MAKHYAFLTLSGIQRQIYTEYRPADSTLGPAGRSFNTVKTLIEIQGNP
jgi:hypothetical protein